LEEVPKLNVKTSNTSPDKLFNVKRIDTNKGTSVVAAEKNENNFSKSFTLGLIGTDPPHQGKDSTKI